jgi:tetratricopeptide (TPR) repeat protein
VSYTEAQLRDLLDQADSMAYGPGQLALLEQVIAHADALRLPSIGFSARIAATTAYVYLGEPSRAVVTFAWCVAEFDRDPAAYQSQLLDLLWQFKYTVGALTRSPDVPLERTYAVLDDMQRRWLETGHSLHAVYSHRHRVARHVGDLAAAERYYTLWCAAPRDELSDCAGCDPEMKAYWLGMVGRDEEAVALGEPVLNGQTTCLEQPQSILTTLMLPYLRTGRLDQARDAHRRAYRAHRTRVADLGEIADHVEFCARTGNEARALEIVERHRGWLDRAPSPWAEMVFAASAALALRRAGQPATTVDELTIRATAIADRFDRRNGTDRVGTLVRGILEAQPLIDYLPLSATAPRTRGAEAIPPRPSVPMPDPRQLDALARSERAGEAIAGLVETVADRTAHGDEAAAADARHSLAIAYLNNGRLLDAAEVAEEELAQRLRADTDPTDVRRLLVEIYERLGEADEALAQLEAMAAQTKDPGSAGQLARTAGEILDRQDRDDEAAERFLVAAQAFAEAGWRLDELECRRQHARSLFWAFGPDPALPALRQAQELAAGMTGGGAAGELVRLDYDAARIYWAAGELGEAAGHAERAAQEASRLGETVVAAEARITLARILLDGGEAGRAESEARRAIAELPQLERLPPYVEVLAEAVRRQGRDGDAVWSEFGLTQRDDD